MNPVSMLMGGAEEVAENVKGVLVNQSVSQAVVQSFAGLPPCCCWWWGFGRPKRACGRSCRSGLGDDRCKWGWDNTLICMFVLENIGGVSVVVIEI